MPRRPKIFFIGLNKTGTTSLHRLIVKSGYRAIHWKDEATGIFLAKRMFSNFGIGLPLISGIEEFDAYSELSYIQDKTYLEATVLFELLVKENPDAYFILNSRSRDSWVLSRKGHHGIGGSLFVRFQNALGKTPDEVIELWKRQHDAHNSKVRAFFQNTEYKFMEFELGKDDIANVCEFLSPDYEINSKYWQKTNAAKHPKSE